MIIRDMLMIQLLLPRRLQTRDELLAKIKSQMTPEEAAEFQKVGLMRAIVLHQLLTVMDGGLDHR